MSLNFDFQPCCPDMKEQMFFGHVKIHPHREFLVFQDKEELWVKWHYCPFCGKAVKYKRMRDYKMKYGEYVPNA